MTYSFESDPNKSEVSDVLGNLLSCVLALTSIYLLPRRTSDTWHTGHKERGDVLLIDSAEGHIKAPFGGDILIQS